MSDRYGLLQFPLGPTLENPDLVAIGDPLLDVLKTFLTAAINADLKAQWSVIHPAVLPGTPEALPVSFAYTHDPAEEEFTSRRLPALFVWRSQFPKFADYTEDWDSSNSIVHVLWVPPLGGLAKDRFRQPFRNAVAKSIRRNLRRQRHPAYIAPGDTSEAAQTYGTFMLPRMGAARLNVSDAKPFDLIVHKGDKQEPYDAVLASLEVLELGVPTLSDYDPLSHVQGTFHQGEPALTTENYTLRPTISSVTPSTGPLVGGTTITIQGAQFFESVDPGALAVTIGGLVCTEVTLVEETILTAKTPAGASLGAKDVKVTVPSGSSATAVGAFTYV